MKAGNVAKLASIVGCSTLLILGLFAFPGILFGLLLVASSKRTIYERVQSPDVGHEARVQFDDAGAVSGYARLVFVKSTLNPSDTPLLSCRAFWGEGQAKIKLVWLDSSTLLIRHHFAPDNVAAVSANCSEIRIVAEAVPPFEGE